MSDYDMTNLRDKSKPQVRLDRPRTFHDPIHDDITPSHRAKAFIDTPQFQRLREIKQLGTSYYVWPGASHNRFEHSLGVAFLARKLALHLQREQPELRITDRDVECVEIAGLCHDLGHGPWSHVWDNIFMPQALKGTGKTWTHEEGSELMLDALVNDPENDVVVNQKDLDFIKALIRGDRSKCDSDEKGFLFDIVANDRNKLDVDKYDYIMRDSRQLGHVVTIAINRVINSARVIEGQICYEIKTANQIYEIFQTRFELHKGFYAHKTAKAIEYMLVDALLLVNLVLQLSESVFDKDKFLELDDSLLRSIERSKDPNLAEAQNIIRRIRYRDLYHQVEYKFIPFGDVEIFKEHFTVSNLVEEANRHTSLDNIGQVTVADVIVDWSEMHYGQKEKNPLSNVKFYSKFEPNKCREVKPGDYSILAPDVFSQTLLRVYTKKPEFFGRVQAAYRNVLDHVPPTAYSRATTERPSTPPPGGSRLPIARHTPNPFMDVPPSYSPDKRRQKQGTKRTAAEREHGYDSSGTLPEEDEGESRSKRVK